MRAKPSSKPSKVTIPTKAHPLARLVFTEMQRQGITYDELEWTSGMLRSTIKAWRAGAAPRLVTMEAALGALGWTLVPVPTRENIPADVLDMLEEVGQHFRSDDEAFGAVLQTLADWPGFTAKENATMAKMLRGKKPPKAKTKHVPLKPVLPRRAPNPCQMEIFA